MKNDSSNEKRGIWKFPKEESLTEQKCKNPSLNPQKIQRHRRITQRNKNMHKTSKNEVMRVGAPLASSLTAPSDCTDLQATQGSMCARHKHATSFLDRKPFVVFRPRKQQKCDISILSVHHNLKLLCIVFLKKLFLCFV